MLPLFFVAAACLNEQTDPGNLLNLTAEERSWLDRNPDKLTLYFNTEFPPIEFISEAGAFIGLGADIISRVEDLLGITFVKKPSDDWNEHLAALKSGECAVAPTIVKTAERENYVFFTLPYATVPVVIITTQGVSGSLTLNDFHGRRIGVVSGYATEKYLRDQALFGHFEVVSVANVPQGLQSVSFGQIDAFAENLAVAAYYIDTQGIPNLRVAGVTDYAFAWSIGVSREYPLLYSAIQKALDAISQRELEGVRKQWIAFETNFWMDPETLKLLKVAALFMALLLASLVVITIFLKRRLNEKVIGLRASEERFRLSMEAVNDGIWDWDIRTDHVYYSPGYVRMLGYEAGEDAADGEAWTGKAWAELIHPEDREQVLKANLDCIENRVESFAVEYRMQARDGSWRWILGRGRAVARDASGRAIRLIGTHQDITERKLAEQEREKLQAQLLQAQKMESVGILAGGIAHDFNNLLHAMRGNIELLLQDKPADSPDARRLETVTRSMDRAAQLVQQLLFFSRKSGPRRVRVDLNAEVEDMVRMLERTIPKAVSLKIRLDQETWPIFADPVQVEQVLLNLVGNALDAMPDGGRLVMETSNAVLEEDFVRSHPGSTAGCHVLVSVTDTGCGMEKAVLDHIFDPFFTTKGVGKGTGLGLASAYGIVKAHGGYIQCYSEPGLGTTFRIFWPAMHGDAKPAGADQLDTTLEGGSETILVVDDDPEISGLTRETLEMLGYAVRMAASGEQALELFRKHEDSIDMVLLDLNMPGMGGRRCLQELLQEDPTVKVVIASGYTANGHGRDALDKGAKGFIGKPYQLKELAALMRAVLDG